MSHPAVIRNATPGDLPAIAAIQDAAPETARWEPASYLACDCRVAMVESAVVAFLVSRQTGPGEREILNVAVAPSQRRRGIARRLLERELISSRGRWFLEVRESNAAAISLYKSLGFEAAGYRTGYYHEPPDAAIVMSIFS